MGAWGLKKEVTESIELAERYCDEIKSHVLTKKKITLGERQQSEKIYIKSWCLEGLVSSVSLRIPVSVVERRYDQKSRKFFSVHRTSVRFLHLCGREGCMFIHSMEDGDVE